MVTLIASALYLARLAVIGAPLLRARLWSEGPDRFGDFWHYQALFPYLHTSDFFLSRERFAYPAPCAIIYQVLYSLGPYKHLIFDLSLWTVEAVSAALLAWAWVRQGLCRRLAVASVLLITLASHPWHMLYDRGNLEIFLYLLIGTGLWAFLTGRPYLAAALWGAAAAMKIYPILLLAVFLRRRQLPVFLTGVGTCAAVLLVSFAYVGPTIPVALRGTLRGLQGFQVSYGGQARRNEIFADHSLLASIKTVLNTSSRATTNPYPRVQLGYEIAVLLGLPVLWSWRIRRAPALNQICTLLLLMVLLPTVSYDYTLVHTYLVFGVVATLLVKLTRAGRTLPHAGWLFAAFATLAAPIPWLRLGLLDLNGLLKCLALMVLIGLLTTRESDLSEMAPATRAYSAAPITATESGEASRAA